MLTCLRDHGVVCTLSCHGDHAVVFMLVVLWELCRGLHAVHVMGTMLWSSCTFVVSWEPCRGLNSGRVVGTMSWSARWLCHGDHVVVCMLVMS